MGTRGANGRQSAMRDGVTTVDAADTLDTSDLAGDAALGGCARAPWTNSGAQGLSWVFLPGTYETAVG